MRKYLLNPFVPGNFLKNPKKIALAFSKNTSVKNHPNNSENNSEKIKATRYKLNKKNAFIDFYKDKFEGIVILYTRGSPPKAIAPYIILDLSEIENFNKIDILKDGNIFKEEKETLLPFSKIYSQKIDKLIEKIKYYENKILSLSKDFEDLHQFRVNIRKLVALLKTFGICEKEKIKNISQYLKLTNKKRDIDVFLEFASALPLAKKEEFLSHLKEMQTKEEKNIIQSLQEKPFSFEIKFTPINEPAIFFLYKTTKFIKTTLVKKEKNLHKKRVRFKLFRYILENFKEFFNTEDYERIIKLIKKIQDSLGYYHDAQIQQNFIKELPLSPSFQKKFCKTLKKKEKKWLLSYKKLYKEFQRSSFLPV